jgi:aconitate hydratase
VSEPDEYLIYTAGFLQPPQDPASVEIYRGPNIVPPPLGKPLPNTARGEVLIKLGDNVSTDDILPAGNEILSLRSNIPAISEYAFAYVDRDFVKRARRKRGGFIVARENYGQGSSREHAAIMKLYLGLKGVLALSYARIHESNLVNFGIAPLRFESSADYSRIEQGDMLEIQDLRRQVARGEPIRARNRNRGEEYLLQLVLSRRQVEILLAGGLSLYLKGKWGAPASARSGD